MSGRGAKPTGRPCARCVMQPRSPSSSYCKPCREGSGFWRTRFTRSAARVDADALMAEVFPEWRSWAARRSAWYRRKRQQQQPAIPAQESK